MYDFVDNSATPHIDAYAGPDVESNSPLHQYGKTWPFENKTTGAPTTYQWIPGTHKFFGWLVKDANGTVNNAADDMTPATLFGDTFIPKVVNDVSVIDAFNTSTKTLTIPATTIDHNSPQFDFMYSDINVTEPTNDAVAMEFYHLFTAVSIGVENSTSSYIKIYEFKIEGIPSTRGASISFNGTEPIVVYTGWTEKATFTRGLDANKAGYEVSPHNLRSNIFNGSTTQEFMMLWPVDAAELHSTEKTTTTEEGVVQYPSDWKMYIKYTIRDNLTSEESEPYEKRINFPAGLSWEAGKKNHMSIVFADKMVELKTEVKPWEYEEQNIDYTNEGVTVNDAGKLVWDHTVSSVDDAAKMVSIVNAQAAKAMFTIQTPIGGSWIVSLVGDVNAFEVSPATGIIDSQTATIYVKPLVSSPTRDYKVQLKFTVRRSDGRMIDANTMIQCVNDNREDIYTVVLPRNN